MRFLYDFLSAGVVIRSLENGRICYLLACGAMWCAEAALGIANLQVVSCGIANPQVAFWRIANPTERGNIRHSVLRVN